MTARRAIATILLAVAAGLAVWTGATHIADITPEPRFELRGTQLDGWVQATRIRFWLAAALAMLGGALLPVRLPSPSRTAGRRLALLLAMVVVAYAAWISWTRLDRIPHVFDEFNYLFQAKNFAAGQMSATNHEFVRHFNQLFFVVHGDRWYGSSLPGHPLLLALGVLLGAPWLVNPVSAGLTLLILHRFLERTLGVGAALVGALLLAASPFFQILSAVYLAHGTALLCCAAFLHFFTGWVEEGRTVQGLLSGVAFGLGFLARPQAVGIWAIPLAIWALVHLARGTTPLRRRLPFRALIFLLPVIPLLIFNFTYNRELTGEWLNTPRAIVSPSHRIGFGPDVGRPMMGGEHTGHTPARGLANTVLNLRLLQRDLFGWWGLSLLLLPFSVLALRRHAMTAVAWGALLINAGLYFAYFTPSPLYGPRYYFETLPALLLLTLQGGRRLAGLFRTNAETVRRALIAGLGLLTLASLTYFRPAQLDRYQPLKATAIRDAVRTLPAGPALVLMPPPLFTTRAQSFNDPDLSQEVVFGSDLGDRANRKLMAAMPERSVYRLRYDRAADQARITPYDDDRLRVLLIGFDGATWDVMEPMVERGELPTFARLRREGVWAHLETLVPTVSPAIWTTIATGLLPPEHGITHFVGGPEGGLQLQTSSDRRKAAALWDMMARNGRRSLVVNYWCTWPAERVPGVVVSDRATLAELPRRVHPTRLTRLVESKLGTSTLKTVEGEIETRQHAGIDEDAVVDLSLALLDREPAPLALLYFRELDIVQHRNWKYYEPEGFDLPPAHVKQFADRVPEAYRRADRRLARILDAVPDDVTVILVSDHGMKSVADLPPRPSLRMNRVLSDLGLLVYTQRPYFDRERSVADSATTHLDETIVVNTRPAEADRVRRLLASLELDGEPLFEVVRASPEKLELRLADPHHTSGAITGGDRELRIEDFIVAQTHRASGQHTHGPPGILVMRGPGIDHRDQELTRASVVDIAPTILALLSLPPDPRFAGSPLAEALDDGLVTAAAAASPVRYERVTPPSKLNLPPEVENDTIEELRSLGYLD